MTDEPNVPDPLAAMDQAMRGMADMAKLTRAFFDAQRKAGFSKGEAMALTQTWLAGQIRSAQAEGGE